MILVLELTLLNTSPTFKSICLNIYYKHTIFWCYTCYRAIYSLLGTLAKHRHAHKALIVLNLQYSSGSSDVRKTQLCLIRNWYYGLGCFILDARSFVTYWKRCLEELHHIAYFVRLLLQMLEAIYWSRTSHEYLDIDTSR